VAPLPPAKSVVFAGCTLTRRDDRALLISQL
jgi:hypothetical protein